MSKALDDGSVSIGARLRCRIRGHRWGADALHYGMLRSRCCHECGCGRVVGFTKGDIYGNGPPFVVPGKACHHAREKDCVPASAKRIPYHRGILP